MSKSKIEWCDATWNITSGCTKVSSGCANCYAERLVSTRLRNLPQNDGVVRYNDRDIAGRWTGKILCHDNKLNEPLRRKKPTRYFVCSQSDLFHEDVSFEFIDKAFAVMVMSDSHRANPRRHTFMVLTKRPGRMEAYLKNPKTPYRIGSQVTNIVCDGRYVPRENGMDWHPTRPWPLDNVWLGTSVESQQTADERIPHLLACPAAHRFLSCEPLLGMVDLSYTCFNGADSFGTMPGIDWVICGGESGPNARPVHPDWVRSLRDQCQEANVPFMFKQWGEWQPISTTDGFQDLPFLGYNVNTHFGFNRVGKTKAGHILDGREWMQFPWAVAKDSLTTGKQSLQVEEPD